jgi:hypothetical protein
MTTPQVVLHTVLALVNVMAVLAWIAVARQRQSADSGRLARIPALGALRARLMRWLVIVVILYAAVSMLRSARAHQRQ